MLQKIWNYMALAIMVSIGAHGGNLLAGENHLNQNLNMNLGIQGLNDIESLEEEDNLENEDDLENEKYLIEEDADETSF